MNELLSEIQAISKQLIQVPEQPNAQRDYLVKLSSLKARVNDIKPEADNLYSKELATVTESILLNYKDNIKGNSALVKNMIQGKMATHQKLVDYVDRVSSTINLQSDNLRTVISFEKELLKSSAA